MPPRPEHGQVARSGRREHAAAVRFTTAAALMVAGLSMLLVPATASAHYSSGIFAPDPSSGPSGTHLAIRGLLHGEPHPITLRWDSLSGPSIGTVTVDPGGRSYSADVTIPDAPAGVHLIVLVAGDRQVADTAFEIAPVAPRTTVALQPAGAGGRGSWNLAILLLVPVAIRALSMGIREWRRRQAR